MNFSIHFQRPIENADKLKYSWEKRTHTMHIASIKFLLLQVCCITEFYHRDKRIEEKEEEEFSFLPTLANILTMNERLLARGVKDDLRENFSMV